MRAARFYNKGDIRIEDVPEPAAQSDQVLVEIEWCGICGSDLHEYLAGPLVFPTDTPHPLTGDVLPCIMGHEFCGRIKHAPKGSAYREGQGVVVDPRLLCRSCTPCVTGVDHCCLKIGFLGYSGRGGGFSEVVAVDSNMLHAIPDNVSIADVAIAEPLATAHHAVKAAGIHNWGNTNTLVIGGGPVGLMLILALRAQGVKHIAVSEPTSARREHLKNMADLVINPLEQDVSAVCKESTQGLGPDVVFDCAGVPQSIETAFKAIRIGGIHVNVAVWEKPMILPVWDFLFKDITVRPALAYNDQDFSEVMQMLSEGKFHGYEKLVSTRIALEDLVEKGLEQLIHNKDAHLKILVTPKADNLIQ